jgi:predicted transcriptional regulator
MYSLANLQILLSQQRKMLVAGDNLPTLTELSKRAGIHRDTIYTLLNGERVCLRTQYALSRVLQEVEQETSQIPKTNLLSLSFNQEGVSKAYLSDL